MAAAAGGLDLHDCDRNISTTTGLGPGFSDGAGGDSAAAVPAIMREPLQAAQNFFTVRV
jgi:hypothetical protein